MKWTKSEDFSKMGIGWFLRHATFVEFCFMLMIKLISFLDLSVYIL